jgi:hypothetical protein
MSEAKIAEVLICLEQRFNDLVKKVDAIDRDFQQHHHQLVMPGTTARTLRPSLAVTPAQLQAVEVTMGNVTGLRPDPDPVAERDAVHQLLCQALDEPSIAANLSEPRVAASMLIAERDRLKQRVAELEKDLLTIREFERMSANQTLSQKVSELDHLATCKHEVIEIGSTFGPACHYCSKLIPWNMVNVDADAKPT